MTHNLCIVIVRVFHTCIKARRISMGLVMLLWLDSKAAKDPYASFESAQLRVVLTPPLRASWKTRLSLIDLYVKNIRGVSQGQEIVYVCCDIVRPSLLNGEQRPIVTSILKSASATIWSHKWFSVDKRFDVPVWPGEHSSLSIYVTDASGNRYPCDYIGCVINIVEEWRQKVREAFVTPSHAASIPKKQFAPSLWSLN